MNCRDVEPLLATYFSGPDELSSGEFAGIGRHLDSCDACSEQLAELQWVVAQVKLQPRAKAPPDLAAKLHLRLAREGIPPAASWAQRIFEILNWPSLALGAAAAAVVMLAVMWFPGPRVGIQVSAVPVDQNVAVQIAFDVGEDVKDVTFDIKLQDGLKFIDAKGQPVDNQEVVWKGELKRGKTVVPVSVRGVRPGKWEILAVVRKNQLARETHIIVPVQARRSGEAPGGEV